MDYKYEKVGLTYFSTFEKEEGVNERRNDRCERGCA